MKVVFAGPSLPDAADFARTAMVRDPAASGDVAKAVLDGATVIGIVDGYFEALDPVFGLIRECEDGRDVMGLLKGPVAHTTFTRLN